MIETVEFTQKPVLTVLPLTLNVLTEAGLTSHYTQALQAALHGFESAWPHFMQRIAPEPFLADADIHLGKPWEADMVFVSNVACHAINQQYRHKDAPTDVITFTMYADDPSRNVLAQLPFHHLGSVIINIDWAIAETGITPLALQSETDAVLRGNITPSCAFIMYILERMLHGCLHLLGVTHDTDADYNRVVEIQRYVLNAIIG